MTAPITLCSRTEEFTVAERLQLLSILPSSGDVITLRVVADLRMALAFSEEEMERIALENRGNGEIHWDANKAEKKEIPVGTAVRKVIRDALETRNREKKLLLDHLPLYDRFVESE